MDASKPTRAIARLGAQDATEQRGATISKEAASFFKKLGKRIARLREEKSQSQAELAQILEISEETLAAIEAGERRPPLDSMPKLSRHFLIPISDMIDNTTLALSPKMQRHIEILKRMSKGDQRFILKLAEEMALR